MPGEFWTTDEVAEHLGMTVAQVYESRKRKEYPGDIGKQRGRRLLFNADLVRAGPTTAQTTNDPLEAILWTLQGIEKKLGQIVVELQVRHADQYFTAVLSTTTEEEE